jgi:hypothetical protein
MDASDRGECIAHVSKSMANQSPGPAFYNVNRSFEGGCPTILMKGRRSLPSGFTDVQLYNLPTTIGKVTGITLHGRTEIRPTFHTPGPSYLPPRFGSNARMCGFPPISYGAKPRGGKDGGQSALGRPKNPSATIGPGPAAFVLRDKSFDATGNIGYTIKGCHDFQIGGTESPGPGAYAPKFNAVLKTGPKIAFHSRTALKGPPETPGYRGIGSSVGEGPKFTMKARANDEIQVI